MLKKIISKLDIHTLDVIVKTSKTMLVKIVGMIALFLVSIFLGRTLGSEGLGIVNFAIKFEMILLVLTMFGFQNVIIKFISIGKGKPDNQGIASALKTSLIFNGLLSLLIAALGSILLPIILEMWSGNQDLYIPLLIVFFMLIPQTISRVYVSALNGYGKIWQANLVNQTLSILLVGIGLLIYWSLDIQFTPISVLVLYGISRIFMVLIVLLLWKQTFRCNIKGQFNLNPMFKMAMPLLLVTGTAVISNNIDIVMLGSLGTFNEVGIYSVAALLAMLTSLFLQASNTAIAPKLANLFFKKKINEMQIMVKKVTTGLIFIAILFMVFFIFFGKQLLGLWGTDFQEAYLILIILATGQFVNISTGCSGFLLVMCGFERIHGYISLFGVVLNILLNIFLISKYGALGAGIATAITVMIENINKVYWVYKKIGILTIPYPSNN